MVARVRSQQMAKMPLAEHDNVVKTFPPDRTDRPFTIPVLPRRSRRIPNAHRPKAADEDVTVDRVAVTDDVSRLYFPTIGLGELARNPFRRWVRGHFQPQYLAAIVMQYQQSVEQSERDCRDHEQVHRRDAVGVIMKERLPPLGRRSPSPCHILCNGGLPDIHAELEKLAMDPWCAPQWGKTLLGIRHLIREISLAISHKVKASPDSTSLASQIEFPI